MNRVSPSHRQPEPCASPAPGRFYAYATDEGPCSGHKVPEAESFTDAAIGFLECWGPNDDTGQEEVFSKTAVEQGIVKDPPAMGPVTDCVSDA